MKRGKRIPLHLRTTYDFRKQVEDAALKSGRSMAQEMEFRLERSFWLQDMRRELSELQIGLERLIFSDNRDG